MSEVYIYDAVRTPRGKGKTTGSLYEVRPIDLIATLLRALETRQSLPTDQVEDFLLGCVTPIGDQGYNVAKAGLLHAEWPYSIPALTLNRYCASGLETVNLAAAKIIAGQADLILAGGIESMSRVPMGSDGGALLFDPEVINKVAYVPQGISADLIATIEGFTREELDTFALYSHQKAATAREKGHFMPSLVPVLDPNGLVILAQDESIRPETDLEQLGQLRPAFKRLGQDGFDALAISKYPEVLNIHHHHTAGNSSGIVDGASIIVLGSERCQKEWGLQARARILSSAVVSLDPTIMLTGPYPASQKALKKAGLQKEDIDLWEVNEAFASVVLKFMRDMDLNPEKVNVNGGAISMGHPLGATGAILVGTLLDELERRDLQRGLVTLCVGGGMGVATIIERV
ncbi:MAG: acetyl-CoA C-acetyltransferase [Bacteroidota bacterium]